MGLVMEDKNTKYRWPLMILAMITLFVATWAGFLVLTIAGERLELGRKVNKSNFVQQLFFAISGIFLAGLVIVLFAADLGVRITGIGMFGLAFWLLGFDIARRTVKQTELTRFIAVLATYLIRPVFKGFSR